MSYRSLALLSWLGLTAAVPAQRGAQAVASELVVTGAEAQQLILVTQTAPRYRRFMSFEPIDLSRAYVRHPDWFAAYQLISSDARQGSANRGFWAVNRKTGDLWDTFLCVRVQSPGALRFRQQIRRRSGLSAHAWHQATSERPCTPV